VKTEIIDLQEVLKLPAGAAVMLHTTPALGVSVWSCRICKRVHVGKAAGIYWDGITLFGLVCLDEHTVDELESTIRRASELQH
jgi:hypothetical protein